MGNQRTIPSSSIRTTGSLELHHAALHIPATNAPRCALSWGTNLTRDPLEVCRCYRRYSCLMGGENGTKFGQKVLSFCWVCMRLDVFTYYVTLKILHGM